MNRLVDTHAHLDEIPDLPQTIAIARSAGVVAVITAGIDLASDRKVLALAHEYPGFVYPAIGLHPWNIKPDEIDETLAFIRAHLDEAVAVGEIGLDYHKKVRAVNDKAIQHYVFREVLKIARENGKPVVVHSRYAWQDALSLVEESGAVKAMFHWYTGTSSVLRSIIAQGYYLSATPAVAYHEEHRRAIREAPLDRLLLETDSPVHYRRGDAFYEASPTSVLNSLKDAAEIRGLPEDELARITTENAARLFNLDFG